MLFKHPVCETKWSLMAYNVSVNKMKPWWLLIWWYNTEGGCMLDLLEIKPDESNLRGLGREDR